MPYSRISPSSLLHLILSDDALSPRAMATLLRQGSLTVKDLASPIAERSLVNMTDGPTSGLVGQVGADDTALVDPMDEWDKDRWASMRTETTSCFASPVREGDPDRPARVIPLWALWLIHMNMSTRARGLVVLGAAYARYQKQHPEATFDVLAPLDVVTPDLSSNPENRLVVWRVIDLLACCLSPKSLAHILDSLPVDRVRGLARRRPPSPTWPMLSLNWIWNTNRAYVPVDYEGIPRFQEEYAQVLMARGWSLDQSDFSGRPPILYARSVRLAQTLFDLGADPSVKTPAGDGLVELAAGWGGRASERVATITTVQGWIAERSAPSPESDKEKQNISPNSAVLQIAEVLVRTASLTALRTVLKKMGAPAPQDDTSVLLNGLARRILSDQHVSKASSTLLRWAFSHSEPGGWWDLEAPIPEIPGWTSAHLLGVVLSASSSGNLTFPPSPVWCLPLSSPETISAFVRWSGVPFFQAFEALKGEPSPVAEAGDLGRLATRALGSSFRYSGPKRPLDLALAEDACVEDISPPRPGHRATLGLRGGNLLTRIGGHVRILESSEVTRGNPKFTPGIQAVWETAALMTARRIIISAGVDNLIFGPDRPPKASPRGYNEIISLSSINACYRLLSDLGVQRRNPGWFADTMLLLATPVSRFGEEYNWGCEDQVVSDLHADPACSVYTATMAQLAFVDPNVSSPTVEEPAARSGIRALVDYLVLSFGIPEPPPEDAGLINQALFPSQAPPRRLM